VIKGAIFDADGTLLESTAMWMKAGARYLSSLGIEASSSLGDKMFSMTLNDSAAFLREAFQMEESCEEIVAGINGTILQFYREDVSLKPGAKEFLEALHQLGIPMTLATATDRVVIEAGLRHTGILHYFSKVFTCGEVGLGKEHPEIYLQARAHMGSPLENTWVFEDALHGAKSAKSAGLRLAAVYDAVSERQQEALQALSDIYLPDLCDFEGFLEGTKRI